MLYAPHVKVLGFDGKDQN